MVRGAVRSVAALLAALSIAGCVRAGQGGSSQADEGTCYGACDHYLGCKGDERKESRDTCLSECREIFVQDGEPDRGSLREFENLACDQAVAFVDGDGAARSTSVADSASDASESAGKR